LDSTVAFSPSACPPSAALQALAGGPRAAQARRAGKKGKKFHDYPWPRPGIANLVFDIEFLKKPIAHM